MSKTIKVSQATYEALLELQEKRETFDTAVCRLIQVFKAVRGLAPVLERGRTEQQERFAAGVASKAPVLAAGKPFKTPGEDE